MTSSILRTARFFFPLFLVAVVSTKSHTQVDTISYSIGMSLGLKLQSQGVKKLNYPSMMQAIQDIIEGGETILTKEESERMNYNYFQEQRDQMALKAKQEGIDFLAENGKRPEVTTTESGLQYEILVPADGEKPTASNKVTVHYVGQLLSGEMFDSSVDRGKPATFPLSGVISGWTEGVQLMSKGAKYRFYIPQELAYGSRGAGGVIPPYAALIFDIELFDWE
ncbi:MAG: FKBP-type peptidyl-prolyl cis-trans isomerase [Bacteroidota bacterium]